MFSFVEVSFLFADMHGIWATEAPSSFHQPPERGGDKADAGVRWILLATPHNEATRLTAQSGIGRGFMEGDTYVVFVKALQL
jgi:hypothetical protein